MVVIYHLAQLIRGDCIGFRTRYKRFLLNCISICTEIINTDAHLTFMVAAVHIAIYGEGQIAVIIYTDDPDRVLVIPAAHIAPLLVREAEHFRQFVFISVIKPEVSLLHKRHDRFIAVCLILDIICRGNSEQDSVPVKLLLRSLKNLFHIPVVVQQIDRIHQKPHTEEFLHIIKRSLAVFVLT